MKGGRRWRVWLRICAAVVEMDAVKKLCAEMDMKGKMGNFFFLLKFNQSNDSH